MNELWKDVKGYEGLYQISSLKRIKSIGRKVNTGNGGHRYIEERIKCPNSNGIVSLNGHPYNIDSLMLTHFTEEYMQEFRNKTCLSGEIWKPITGYESLYEISNMGRVRSLPAYTGDITQKMMRRGRYIEMTVPQIRLGRVLVNTKRGIKQSNGSYMEGVSLAKNGTTRHFLIHRLVAEHFIPNPNNLKEVSHKDRDITNNHVSNLEWISPEDNKNHAYINKDAIIRLYRLANNNNKTPEEMLDILIDVYTKRKGN